MRVLVQRVIQAQVTVNHKVVGQIGPGLLAFFGVHLNDQPTVTTWLAKKLTSLRIFSDQQGKMNLNVTDIEGEILVVSQFTLYASCQNGNRPDFKQAALPELAFLLYEKFLSDLIPLIKKPLQTGVFGADMAISLVNDGPVTLLLEK
ncbi:MAG: D-tyrosyl-tRNA(Tyr) deacylase [Chlamydiia bacterium]|nr:D-tyrosyl-tRNA(Tyr) deacylase [Chlamydiia bacterium]